MDRQWQRAEPHDRPAIFQKQDIKIGMYQTIGGPNGRYAYQEDALISFFLPEFKNANDKMNSLYNTLENLQKTWGQEKMVGSTACGTIAWIDENVIRTYNLLLGDGIQVLCILDKQGHLKQSHLLNPHLQNLSNPEEFKRLQNSGFIKNGRLGGVLALSGALGDTEFERSGLTHTPTITIEHFTLSPNDKIFIVVSTDGLLEAGYEEKKIGEFVAKNNNKTLDAMAKQLAQEAIKVSTDNVAIGILQPGKSASGIFAFDGHGGTKVSNNLATHFYDVLKEMTAAPAES